MLICRDGNNVLHKKFQLCGRIHMLTHAITPVRILSELVITLIEIALDIAYRVLDLITRNS